MSRLALFLLGSPRIERDGAPLRVDRRKSVALIAYLAMTGETHSRDTLATLLWPEHDQNRARAGLRAALSTLKKALGHGWLDVDRESVGLNPNAIPLTSDLRSASEQQLWLDVDEFRGKLAECRTHGHPEEHVWSDCLLSLAEAAELYRDDFLAGFTLRDSPAFDEWQFFQTEELRNELLGALARLAQGYGGRGEFQPAITHARRWAALDPLHEPAHRQLMRLYGWSGQRAAALRQYDECTRVLQEELSVSPEQETEQLYRMIKAHREPPPPEDRFVAPVTGQGVARKKPQIAHNLPVQPTPFVGRAAELAEIHQRLADPDCRLLTLVGPGGVGKTRLALEAASSLVPQMEQDGLADGVYLVRMAPLESAEALVTAVGKAVGFTFYGDAENSAGPDPKQQVLDYLRQKRLLLLMDNFEHLLEGVELVTAMLAAAPDVKVLVTSRARLGLQGEHLYMVTGMPFPDPVSPAAVETPEKVLAYSAVKLFMQMAQRVYPGFEPQVEELAAIAHICHLVEGMPLGVLLAAAWVDMLSPQEIAAEVKHSLDLLETDLHDVPERQCSIHAVFDWSWNLLTERERGVFQALSVFRGGFTRAAAQHVSGGSLRELRALADKSLLQVTPSGRYEIHELMRRYTAEKLHSSPQAATDVADRHCAYYTAALQRWGADFSGSRQQEALVEMEEESGNVSAAWTCAVERGQVERLDRAMEGFECFCYQGDHYREGLAAFQAAGAAAEKAAARGADDRAACLRVWVRALAWQSRFQRAIGKRDAARRLQQKCLAILQDPALTGSDTRLERAVLSMSVGLTVGLDDNAQGRQRVEEGYFLFRELGHRTWMAWALRCWGVMATYLGDYADAKRRLEEALAISRALGNQQGIAGSFSGLSRIACVEGRLAEAEHLAREGVATSLETGFRSQSAAALLNLGQVLEQVAKFSEAHAAMQQSLEFYTDLGHRHYITIARSLLGSVELHLGRYEETRDHAQTGLALAREHGPRSCVALNLLLLGCLELAQGVPATAHPLLEESAAVYREARPKDDLALALACLAIAARRLGDTPGARQHLCHALEIAQESGAVPPLMWALPATALLLASEGENERAVELYALASHFPLVAKSRWFADVAGNILAEAAAALPAEGVTVLQERGQMRDLEATAAELLAELCE